jgi:large subunit ribosomal protein L13
MSIPKPVSTPFTTKEAALADRKWHVVDVAGLTLGRAATKIAHVLRGKHKPTFTKHVDSGDYVVVVNAEKVHLTGRKMSDKLYHRHTQFPGGLISIPAEEMLRKKPQVLIKDAVWGMLPKGPLGRKIFKKLKVYKGSGHPHEAQQPAALKVENA